MKMKNAKPKILGSDTHALSGADTHSASLQGSGGSDTHAASLSGSSSNAEDNAQAEQQLNGTTNLGTEFDRAVLGVVDNVVATFTDIVSPTNSVIILVMGTGFSINTIGNKAWRWFKDTVAIGVQFNTVAGTGDTARARVNVQILAAETGTHTYELKEKDADEYKGVAAKITFVKLTDTHSASLTGSPPTDTHSAQLDGADSHALGGDNTQKTRSTGVIK